MKAGSMTATAGLCIPEAPSVEESIREWGQRMSYAQYRNDRLKRDVTRFDLHLP
jgi:hypothetical protein